jgi:adenylylsulfate kinase
VKVLELDEIRKAITPEPTYTDGERDIVYRAFGYMAKLCVEAGVRVLLDATAHRRAWRQHARRLVPVFAEVQLRCPLEVCRERERRRPPGYAPAGIYTHGGQPGATVPGVDVPYEPSPDAELTIDTQADDVRAQVRAIADLARRLERLASEPAPRQRRPPCTSETG